MSDTIRSIRSEKSIPCLCGKGKIIHQLIDVVNLSSTWGRCEKKYILDCDKCKTEGYAVDYILEDSDMFLVKKIMKIDI